MTEPVAASIPVQPARSLHVLLQRLVDYAGLFPPTSREMAAAVAEYAEHRESEDVWALARFVLPAARLDEFSEAAAAILPREGARSWALSALLGSDLEEDIRRIEDFNDAHRDARAGAVMVDTVELKTHMARDVAHASELLDRRFDTYMEVPIAEDPGELVSAIARTKAKVKLRTGGVTTDVFPSSANVVRFLTLCVAKGVGFKATAGLHHPLRAEHHLTHAHDAPTGMMFGFLNVLLTVAALHAGLDERDAAALLEEGDPHTLRFDEQGVSWCDRRLSLKTLHSARHTMACFGSCSFTEPLSDLRAMSLL